VGVGIHEKEEEEENGEMIAQFLLSLEPRLKLQQ
jgi:hypothetical protein